METAVSPQLTHAGLRRLHVVFKTHFDLGFTDLAANVTNLYLDDFLPRALALAEETRRRGGRNRFVWTVGSWLVWEFLERHDAGGRRRMEQAIAAGDLAWHALPFTLHSELTDVSLFRHGLSLSQRLDERFGCRTIAAKCTDIPGHTRSIVPLLAEAGVKLLHVGVNPASALPKVPPVFRWKSPGNQELMVIYSGDYGETTTLPGLADGLSLCFTGDNLGPQSPEEVDAVYAGLKSKHPETEPFGSTLNAFAETLESVRRDLPVVEGEIGDTWIHGAGSDPAKVAAFRELTRLRRDWIERGRHSPGEPSLDRFSQKLLLVAEHTWGLDVKKCLGTEPGQERTYDSDFAPEVFRGKRSRPAYRRMEVSWAEQRAYLDQAIESLDDKSMANTAREAVDSAIPRPPSGSTSGWESIQPDKGLVNSQYEIGFNTATGAINRLVHRPTGIRLASPSNEIARFRYDLYSSSDYAYFWDHYNRNKYSTRWWAKQDFTKPGLDRTLTRPRHWFSRLERVYKRIEGGALRCRLELSVSEEAVRFGCPRRLVVTLATSDRDTAFHIELAWFDKAANRVPEAMWLGFSVPGIPSDGVRIRKIGEWMDPRNVVLNGARRLHAVDDRIRLKKGPAAHIDLEPLDSPLAALGTPALLRFNNRPPTPAKGIWSNLHNNVWGTNFPLWYDDNGRSRFRLIPARD